MRETYCVSHNYSQLATRNSQLATRLRGTAMTDQVPASTRANAANYAMLFGADFLKKLERLSLISRKLRAGRMKGERRSVKRGTSVEFADYRNYTPGDDLRRVDWNAYARLERLFLKLFQEEEDLTVHVLVDASRSMDWGDQDPLAASDDSPATPR